MTDEKRLYHLTHSLAGMSAGIGGRVQLLRRSIERGEDIDLPKLIREMERWQMRALMLSLKARGADEAAAQMHAEIHAHFREDYPLRDR